MVFGMSPAPQLTSVPRRFCLGLALASAALLAAYWPALRGGFVWNDADYVTRPELRSLHGLWRIWFQLGATEQYYPLLHTAFWVEHRIWGDASWGYHAANLIFHGASAFLFGLILRQLAIPGAWLAALLFAFHPVCVESVAWISEQKNTLSTLFYLGSALLYLLFDQEDAARPMRGYWIALALFVLALLTKSATATLPATLLVICWWRRGRLGRSDFIPLLPWVAVGASSGLFSAWVERTYLGAEGADFALTLTQRCLVASRAIWFYLGKLVWPARLNFIYAHWDLKELTWRQAIFPAATIGLGGILWSIRRHSRTPLAAFLCFAGALFPTLGFFNVYAFTFSYVADHWQYLAVFAVAAFAAAGWARWAQGSAKQVALVGAVAIVGALAALTWRQCHLYRDEETFYRAILRRNSEAWMADNNLGILLAHSGRAPEAIVHYRHALAIKPNYAEADNNLGNALADVGQLHEAIGCYSAALRIRSPYPEAQVNLANAHNQLGTVLRTQGRLAEAAEQFEAAVQLEPDDAEAHNDLGVTLAKMGRVKAGIAELERAIHLKPGYADAHQNLGVLLQAVGRREEGAAEQAEAARLRR